jgi:hypothetical protein
LASIVSFYSILHQLQDCELLIEMFDANLSRKEVFLGALKMTGTELETFVEDSHFKRTPFPLEVITG